MRKEIVITFNSDGTSSVEAVGFQGRGCKEATLPFERALGVAGETKLKPEYQQAPVAPRVGRGR